MVNDVVDFRKEKMEITVKSKKKMKKIDFMVLGLSLIPSVFLIFLRLYLRLAIQRVYNK